MNFLNLYTWAISPKLDHNNQIVVTAPHELYIPSCKFFEIDLGLLLITLPINHIIKITNAQTNYKIISELWLPSSNILTLNIVAKNALNIKKGETLCYLHLLPIEVFLPGNPIISVKVVWNFYFQLNNILYTILQNFNQNKKKYFIILVSQTQKINITLNI